MNGQRRRARRVRSFRSEESEGDAAPRAAADDQLVQDEHIHVHVHVHRDGEGAVAAPSPPVVERRPKRRIRRPTLSGALFPWKEHYEPVAKKRHDELTAPKEGPLAGLVKVFRHVRNLTLAFAAYLFVRR